MKVLILTGRFGFGHLSAANAIKAQIDAHIPFCNAQVVDFLQYASCGDLIYKAFNLLVRRGESVFNHFYNMCDRDSSFGLPLKTLCFSVFSRLLDEEQPDLIISTLPFTSQLAGRYKEKKGLKLPLITWITDTSLHKEWIATGTDFYFTACAGVRDSLVDAGISREKVFISGVPVRADFAPARVQRPDEYRRLLVLGGGFGLICENLSLYSQLDALVGVKTTVICGGNEKMLGALKGRFENVEAVGFVHDMEKYMREADLALGKPGGVTIFEAIASRLPFMSLMPFLAQEKANADYVANSGMGEVLTGPAHECVAQIQRMLWDERKLRACREHMDEIESTLDKTALERVVSSLAKYSLPRVV